MLYILIIVLMLILLYVLGTYNKFVKNNNKVLEAFSTMDVYLKKRWDLIPNLVETVKCYANHESKTLEEVIKLRNSSYDKLNEGEKIDLNNQLSQGLGRLMAISEDYPELKANENFKQLSSSLSSIENDIANSRKYYNAVVRTFNDMVGMVPSNIIAKMFKFSAKSMFEAEVSQRENVNVKF